MTRAALKLVSMTVARIYNNTRAYLHVPGPRSTIHQSPLSETNSPPTGNSLFVDETEVPPSYVFFPYDG
jgi:hypothetical protein